ncbi:hypothetical protein [Leptospira noguchii]|uniref:hypothetical protein n=1 Tax=Leptospira noguchii TaxID=28182 RepID=UPI001FB68F63|nr:hypothetical protein [Leptospira noguchii]UOG32432.1 hypothetical protein MAL06_19805 [Leptospira noguchii]
MSSRGSFEVTKASRFYWRSSKLKRLTPRTQQNAFYESVLGRSSKLSVSLPMGRSSKLSVSHSPNSAKRFLRKRFRSFE